ncbi:MAG: TonB-dependent receptor [Verrucomicrobia bacterium]|nr:TonB-dependent receptor [Verrucomicrobiota bacterium]
MKTNATLQTAACASLWLGLSATLCAQTAARTTMPAAATDRSNETVVLSRFEVSDDSDLGYRKLSTVTTSRVGVPILNQPVAIEVISGELLKDFSVTDEYHVFRYTSSVTVGENEVGQAGIVTMRGFQMPRYFNGVSFTSAGGLTPYLVMDNVDRVEIAKGAQGLFYGNSTPNGVANYITKRPQFTTATSLELTAGTFDYNKIVLDMQGVIKDRPLAWRLISSFYDRNGRVNGQHREEIFLAPSFIYRPSSKFQFEAEFNYSKQKIPYGTFARDFAVNPQFYEDLTNPSPAILNFMKAKYGLANDAAAQARVVERYGASQQWNAFLVNWQADTLERTGLQPFQFTGDTINWQRYSPDGDKFQVSLGNQDGDTKVFDAGVTFTPVEHFSLKYHWTRMDTAANFVRHLVLTNGGLRPDGRVPTLNVQYIDAATNGTRGAYTDVQTLDAVYDLRFANIKHQFLVGAEVRRAKGTGGGSTIDYSRAIPSVSQTGSPLTGIAVYQLYDPFGGKPVPDMWQIVSSPARVTSRSNSDFRDYYATYRASALDGKLDFVLGARQVNQKQTGFDHNTWTVGAVYEVVPGFRAFASMGQNFVFSNRYSIEGPGVTPAELASRKFLNFEKGKGIELGVKSNWKDNTLSGSFSHYFDQRDGIIRNSFNKNSVEARNFDADPNNGVTWAENGGVVQVKGIDGDIAWTPNRRFQAILNLNYEYEAKVVSDPTVDLSRPYLGVYIKTFQRRPQKNPIWRTNLITKYNFTGGLLKNVSVGSALRYSDAYNMSDSPTMDLIVPAEIIVDAFASYRTKFGNTPTEISLNLVNATDTYNDLTRNDGREVRLSVRFKL